jgi:hypothetical protein
VAFNGVYGEGREQRKGRRKNKRGRQKLKKYLGERNERNNGWKERKKVKGAAPDLACEDAGSSKDFFLSAFGGGGPASWER